MTPCSEQRGDLHGRSTRRPTTSSLVVPFEVAVRKAPPVELVHVRTLSKLAAEKILYMFRQIQHPNIVVALDAFTIDDSLHVVLDYIPVSLDRIVSCPTYPDERELATILGQVGPPYPCTNKH